MYRLSTIIEDVFRENLVRAERRKISLNLDFPDVTKRVERPSLVRNPLEVLVPAAISRAKKEVSIEVAKNSIIIRDDGEVLPAAELSEIRKVENLDAKARVGFGNEIKIRF